MRNGFCKGDGRSNALDCEVFIDDPDLLSRLASFCPLLKVSILQECAHIKVWAFFGFPIPSLNIITRSITGSSDGAYPLEASSLTCDGSHKSTAFPIDSRGSAMGPLHTQS